MSQVVMQDGSHHSLPNSSCALCSSVCSHETLGQVYKLLCGQ